MRRKYAVSETEWEVLKMLWKHGTSIRQSELLSLFEKEGREWKRQTLNTFLSRLEEKGLVRREDGMTTPVYSEEEYSVMQMRKAIDTMYNGKFSNLLASFINRNELSPEEAAELRQLLDKNTNG